MITWEPGKALMISVVFHTNVFREGSKLTDQILDDKTEHAEKKNKYACCKQTVITSTKGTNIVSPI